MRCAQRWRAIKYSTELSTVSLMYYNSRTCANVYYFTRTLQEPPTLELQPMRPTPTASPPRYLSRTGKGYCSMTSQLTGAVTSHAAFNTCDPGCTSRHTHSITLPCRPVCSPAVDHLTEHLSRTGTVSELTILRPLGSRSEIVI